MERYRLIRRIREATPEAAQYEQLAEECAELGRAALKMARVLRGENPTPVSRDEAEANVREEYADVVLTAKVAGLQADNEIMGAKLARWIKRLREAK